MKEFANFVFIAALYVSSLFLLTNESMMTDPIGRWSVVALMGVVHLACRIWKIDDRLDQLEDKTKGNKGGK